MRALLSRPRSPPPLVLRDLLPAAARSSPPSPPRASRPASSTLPSPPLSPSRSPPRLLAAPPDIPGVTLPAHHPSLVLVRQVGSYGTSICASGGDGEESECWRALAVEAPCFAAVCCLRDAAGRRSWHTNSQFSLPRPTPPEPNVEAFRVCCATEQVPPPTDEQDRGS